MEYLVLHSNFLSAGTSRLQVLHVKRKLHVQFRMVYWQTWFRTHSLSRFLHIRITKYKRWWLKHTNSLGTVCSSSGIRPSHKRHLGWVGEWRLSSECVCVFSPASVCVVALGTEIGGKLVVLGRRRCPGDHLVLTTGVLRHKEPSRLTWRGGRWGWAAARAAA